MAVPIGADAPAVGPQKSIKSSDLVDKRQVSHAASAPLLIIVIGYWPPVERSSRWTDSLSGQGLASGRAGGDECRRCPETPNFGMRSSESGVNAQFH